MKGKLAKKVSGKRVAKALDKVSIERKRKILNRIEKAIDKDGKIVKFLMEKLHITEDELTLLFGKTRESGLALEEVAKEVLEHQGYKVKRDVPIGKHRYDLVTSDGTFVECKFRVKALDGPEYEEYLKKIKKVYKTDFEPKPTVFLIISARSGVIPKVQEKIDNWTGRRFKVESWSPDEFKGKFLDMKLEQGGMNWSKFAEVIFA